MMHQIARDALRKEFVQAAHCATATGADRPYFLAKADAVLDQFLDYELRATEWDADRWGLDPDDWMCDERAEMRRRAGDQRPIEAVDA